jgi:hypothetical protein
MFGDINLLELEGKIFTVYARKIASILWNDEEIKKHSFSDNLKYTHVSRPPFNEQKDLEKLSLLKGIYLINLFRILKLFKTFLNLRCS